VRENQICRGVDLVSFMNKQPDESKDIEEIAEMACNDKFRQQPLMTTVAQAA
jgi:hypothetical protein